MPAFIDIPQTEVDNELVTISGWVAAASAGQAIVEVNGRVIRHQIYDRPDVRAALPGFHFTAGVTAVADLRTLTPTPMLDISLAIEQDRIERQINVASALLDRWRAGMALRKAARSFCLAHLRCPACGSGKLDASKIDVGPRVAACRACATLFEQKGAAIDMISASLAVEANIAETANISSNPYTPAALDLIDRVTGRGGVVLDCGAGARPTRTQGVINVEIVDYSSTDVLAIGEALPFADATFDAAMSLAVLEHVRDPFRCARELLRVVKPGGELLIDVPFLQPVHGFPHHYYNMTAQGLTNLFAGGTEVLDCFVPPHGHPMFGVQWLLRDYMGGLPADIADSFGGLTVNDIIRLNVPQFLADPRAANLTPEASFTVACLHSLRLQKI